MTGSIVLDVVIGLVFIFLLYSLLATIICEIVATHLGLRERNLKYAISRMLEDSPETSDKKLFAWFMQIKRTFSDIIFNNQGPATCVFYHLPVIKYLGRNTFQSKPAYITKQNFSKAIMEIFRRYGGSGAQSDLEKIQNVLAGQVHHTKALQSLKTIISLNETNAPYQPDENRDYARIYQALLSKVDSLDTELFYIDRAQQYILEKIRKVLTSRRAKNDNKAAVYEVDEMLNLFGGETRSHLASLLEDSNNDLVKFRLHLEQWFENTMDRASGWYKQKIQFTLLIIGFIFAICFNADTFAIIRKLSVDKDLRDKMVQMATTYLNDPKTSLIVESLGTDGAKDSIQNAKAKLDSLKIIKRELENQLRNANSLLGSGWVELPANLPLTIWSAAEEARLKSLRDKGLINYDIIPVKIGNTISKQIITFPPNVTHGITSCLSESGWGEDFSYTGVKGSTISVDTTWRGYLFYIFTNAFSHSFWGFLITALAISLGAPFWFDLLNKLVQIRGATKEPTQAQLGNNTQSTPSDPSHILNRKG